MVASARSVPRVGAGSWRDRFLAATVSFPQWADPVADRLFFVSDESGTAQAWCLDTGTGRRTQLTDQPVGVEALAVLPDGSGAVWWRDETGAESGAWTVTPVDGSPSYPLVPALPPGWGQGVSLAADVVALGMGDDDGYAVWVVEGAGPPRRVFASGPDRPSGVGREWEPVSGGGLSVDGRLLCVRHCEQGDCLHYGLRVLDLAGGADLRLADLVDDGLTLKAGDWSPVPGDGRLSFVHERDGLERPAVWSAAGGRRDYPLDLPGPVDLAGWWPDGSALLVLHEHLGRRTLHRLDVASGRLDALHDPHGWVSGAGVRPDGEVWLRSGPATSAPLVQALDGPGGAPGREVLTAPGPAAPPGRPHRSLVLDGPGGPTHVLLTTPDGPPPYPTVLMVHGGPEWAYADDLDPWEQALADHGYAVAKVNYRGSTGGTVAWRTALHGGNIGFPEVADVVAGLDALVADGVTDPARVAVEGWSWGGYVSVLAAGLEPERFAAVIGGIPVCDSVLCHEDCSPPQQAYDLAIMGGGPDELPALYAERSPITYVDRVRAPVLLIAGEHDSACPIRQVRHYADALSSRGGEVDLYVYPAGHHANAVDEQLRQHELELAFLARHLSP